MKKITDLLKEAIESAKAENWKLAVELNLELIERSKKDLGALNRLGLAYLKLEKPRKARQAFNTVLEIDKSNIIANKHITNLKNNNQVVNTTFANTYFIEEPGKTKISDLHRLCRKDTLKRIQVGQPCKLVLKGKYISVEAESGENDGKYIGTLPDDLSYRLSYLLKRDNEYACLVHSVTGKSCSVHLRETKISDKNKNLQSFPTGGNVMSKNIPEIVEEEEFILEKDIPVETGEHESDKSEAVEVTLEKIQKGKEREA